MRLDVSGVCDFYRHPKRGEHIDQRIDAEQIHPAAQQIADWTILLPIFPAVHTGRTLIIRPQVANKKPTPPVVLCVVLPIAMKPCSLERAEGARVADRC